MNTKPPELDHFSHALLSPLTTLQGTTQLLRRRLDGNGDPQLLLLLGVLERSVERLRVACNLLLSGVTLEGEALRIELPALSFGPGPDGAGRAAGAGTPGAAEGWVIGAPVTLSRHNDGPVLIVAGADSPASAVGAALRERAYRVVETNSSTEGLDQARELRPVLVLIDPLVDSRSEMALQILGEDPDTKAIPLMVLGYEAPAGGSFPPLLVDPEQPVSLLAARVEQILAPGAPGREGGPHILIVDDEPDIARVMALQFEAEGFLTTQIHSGTEVLRIVREQQFDLILLDVILPDIDGFTVLGGLRAQPETQLTPIILVSAINSPMEKVRGLQLGADDYITKPFSAPELSARVQAAMRRSEREGGANPSTRLPGNIAIERTISQRIAHGQPFVVCYCDIDNFKAYNDSYGFLKGDAVIQRTAQILLDAVRAQGNADDFVGHIGGDDFVVISTPDRVATICTNALARFDETAPLFYDAATRARGFISGEDRQGRPVEFPLVSITITAVSSAQRPFHHPGDVAQRSVEGKKRGKLIPGSVYLVEE